MMTIQQRNAAGNLLLRVLEQLDISPTQYKQAVERYEAVGRWLCVPGTSLAIYEPEVSPQGSFRLGTVIKPWDNSDQFDIDLTVKLIASHLHVSQWKVKTLLGDRLREHDKYERMLDKEHHRCWRLLYAEATQFHMDLVPAIPELPFRLQNAGVPMRFSKDPMAITDNRRPDYKLLNANWPKSNMKGFAEWFIERMQFSLNLAKERYAAKIGASIEKVQFFEVKTPLQRAVQLLKRHRDIMFKGDKDAPVSIIITTLAARAYNQYADDNIYDTVLSVIAEMRQHIQRKVVDGKLIYWIENPVNPDENFADKWVKVNRKRQLFFNWLDKVELDFKSAFAKKGLNNIATELKTFLGDDVVNRAVNTLAEETSQARVNGSLYVSPATGTLNTSGQGKQVKDHRFYGH